MKRTTTRARLALALTAAAMVLAVLPVGVSAGSGKPSGPSGGGTVTWDGAGSVSDGKDGLVPADSECEDDDDDEATGPYLDFELENARYVTSATIAFGKDDPVAMRSHDGHFGYHYTAASIDLAAILDDGVTVTYTSRKRVSPRLVLDEGCVESAGITITVVYLGDGTATGGSAFTASTFLTTVCETGSTTNCASFPIGSAPNATQTLTLASATTLDLANDCQLWLYGSSVTWSDWLSFLNTGVPTPEASVNGSPTTTTTPETASRTIYLVTSCIG